MTFVKLKSFDSRTIIYINPEKVESVIGYNDNCDITMVSGDEFTVEGDAKTIASIICAKRLV